MKNQKAFTLVELMVAMILALMLASWAIPNVRSLLLNHKITTKTNGFVGAINYARNEAITHSNSVIVIEPGVIVGGNLAFGDGNTPSSPPTDFDDNEFGQGWRVWVDINNNQTTDNNDIIKIFDFRNDQITFKANQTSLIQFINQGRVRLPQGTNQLTFTVCHKDYPIGRTVTILPTGRARTTRFDLASTGNGQCPPSEAS
jgi:type IV fimbrial biogenesis protein FimT